MPLLSGVLSFIVPAYNEEFELPRTLEAIRSAAKDRPHEIIVADDASTDRTSAVARDGGAKLVSINRRQIAAARNAGARSAAGDVLFFVDADTRINRAQVTGALTALEAGYSGGSSRVNVEGEIPTWSRIGLKAFCAFYFRLRLGAGAFLFTTKKNFEAVGGFDESLFIGEEVYFSLALRKLGRFRILDEPVITSGRKLRIYSAREILVHSFRVLLRGPSVARSRSGLNIWYDGRRETRSNPT
ncbi:MAG TPA: glycosyltransferase [Chthoniobacterales bacterium]|nr:glycosyltransferase [Chthoniobacterales bacterium]